MVPTVENHVPMANTESTVTYTVSVTKITHYHVIQSMGNVTVDQAGLEKVVQKCVRTLYMALTAKPNALVTRPIRNGVKLKLENVNVCQDGGEELVMKNARRVSMVISVKETAAANLHYFNTTHVLTSMVHVCVQKVVMEHSVTQLLRLQLLSHPKDVQKQFCIS